MLQNVSCIRARVALGAKQMFGVQMFADIEWRSSVGSWVVTGWVPD